MRDDLTVWTYTPMTIFVDTREQLPYTFADIDRRGRTVSIEQGSLATGDYSVGSIDVSLEMGIERKTLADLVKSLGHDRARFEREMQRMAQLHYGAIVVEAELSNLICPNESLSFPTKMNPKSMINTLLAWSVRYGVHVWLCPGRGIAEQVTYRLLERWHMEVNENGNGSGST